MLGESKRGVHLQSRDLAILRGLFESRVMSLNHISLMYFEGRKEAATRRVRHLKAAGAIAEYSRQRYQPSTLFLSSAGFQLLQTHRSLVDHPALTWNRIRRRAYVSNPARDRNASASEKNTDLAYWSAVLDVVRMSFKDVSSVPSAGRPQEHPHQRIPYDITSMAQ